MSMHQPIPSIRTMSPQAYEAMLIRFIGGEPDTALYTRREWLSAAAQAWDGDRTDLDAFERETELLRNGHWNDPEPRASESYVPISCERPCDALHGGFR